MKQDRTINPLIKLGLDLGPLVIFFVCVSRFDIFYATAVFMATMVVSLAIGFSIERKVSVMPLITLVLVMIFGGLTLWLHNDIFIRIKPTILYAVFFTVLLAGLAYNRIFLKMLMGQSVDLPDAAWRILTWRWALFFLALAIANEIIWRNFSDKTWAASKIGFFVVTLVFALAQTPFLLRHGRDKNPEAS